ncbi:MAG: aminotransferase class V-fold PLP-dependent enzyme [Oscillospiraceae bacterium]|jgi:arginine/lysine/ornithine decarboxylase|nr:aminotransferase class V-fold PLP-dependent enzyme [Oscillospiraceae bacterium]
MEIVQTAAKTVDARPNSSYTVAMTLLEELQKYARAGILPLHMPGHKRGEDLLGGALPYALDITEVPGFDDLHDMRGVLLGTARLAAKLYGAPRAFPLVNGTTGGILAAVRAVTRGKTGRLVLSRASHRSVWNAAELCGLTPEIITPDTDPAAGLFGSVTPEAFARALDAPNAVCAVITSPTYDGVVSDLRALTQLAHSRGVPLIADAAHGAHFGFSPQFPQNAARLGADVEVVSLHKTLPALTQCSLLLAGNDAYSRALEDQLRVFETSSPSYILLASIDACLRLLESRGAELFAAYARRLEAFGGALRLQKLTRVDRSPRFYGFDAGKIVVSTRGASIDGPGLAQVLRGTYKIETETSGIAHVLAMTSICDTEEGLLRFADALNEIDAGLTASPAPPVLPAYPPGTVELP